MTGPDFGPRGYLPDRAARRARKIVLRERMGVGWPLAAVFAAMLVLAGGVAYVVAAGRPPGPPFTLLAPVAAAPPDGAVLVEGRLLLRAGGSLLVFVAPSADAVWCPASGAIESGLLGAVWARSGRVLGGATDPLLRVPAQVFDGDVYAHTDPGAFVPGPSAAPGAAVPRCATPPA